MVSGKGTLTELERLKAEHREKFKAEAPKVRCINKQCLELLCPQAIGRIKLNGSGLLRIKKVTCTWRRCPKEK